MEETIDKPVVPPRKHTLSEYFELSAVSDHKFEYRNGYIVDMAGGTEAHSLIIMNVGGELRNRLKATPCRVYDSSLPIRPSRTVRYTYPDILVVCGERQFDPDDPNHLTVTNPTLVVEVLSPSTELSDRSEKFTFYLQAPTLKEYLLISQDKAQVETYHRRDDGTWLFSNDLGVDAVVRLRSLGVDLPLSEIYAKVSLPPADEEPAVDAPI